MVTIRDITDKFQEVYYLPDPTPLRMVIAAALSPYMEGSPVWLMMVASSGSGKTELLKTLKEIKNCVFISNMTENTLLSGSRAPNAKGRGEKKEVSLLHRIPRFGSCLVWPEFNTLLDERSEKKAAILSQLRSVFDGQLLKVTGLGDELSWNGKLGLIGACTEKFFNEMEYLDAAGPRFTIYTLPPLNDEESRLRLEKVKLNEHLFEKTMHKIQDMVKDFMDRKVNEGIEPYLEVPKEFDNSINLIAAMLGVSLTSVIRNFKGVITDVYDKTDGTRFYRSGRKLAQAMMVLEEDRILQEDDEKAIIKMMFDTIPRRRHRVLTIASQYEEVNTKGLAHFLHLPTDTVRETLQELNAIGMINRRSGDGLLGDLWSVKPKYRDLFVSYEETCVWKGGNLFHNEDGEEIKSSLLPHLSVFRNEDDPTHSEEVEKNEQDRNNKMFDNF